MKQVAELFQSLTDSQQVRCVRRYNLRKFCRSLNLPAVGVSFLYVDDLNWDYLHGLNRQLTHDKIWFRGGEYFPRSYWDNYFLGHDRRTEYIFLATSPRHHANEAAFFDRYFSGSLRSFGRDTVPSTGDSKALRPFFKNALIQDLIHFAHEKSGLASLGDFYMCLYFLTHLNQAPQNTVKDEICASILGQFPHFRSDVTRINTTLDTLERLNDLLWVFHKFEDQI